MNNGRPKHCIKCKFEYEYHADHVGFTESKQLHFIYNCKLYLHVYIEDFTHS